MAAKSKRFVIPSWPQGAFALRMLVAAVAAYGVSALLGYAHGYSAVFSALIVMRPYQQGAWRAAGQRLVATALGIAMAFVSVMARQAGLNDYELLVLAMAPLSLLVAYDSGYRTAMISALLMLSAPFSRIPELDIAVARAVVVSLGAVIGIAVSLLVLPQPHHHVVAVKATQILRTLLAQIRATLDPARAGKLGKIDDRLRKHLLELGQMARDHRPKNADDDASNRIVGLTRHIQALSILLRGAWRQKAFDGRAINDRYNVCSELDTLLYFSENKVRGKSDAADMSADVWALIGQLDEIEGAPEKWLLRSIARDLIGLSYLMK